MHNNFLDYAKYYDLLYRDKSYEEEVDYIINLLLDNSVNDLSTILDLGCGTGKHDYLLTNKGYKTTGVDISEQMVNIARTNYPNLDFINKDLRTLNLNKRFDAVLSLFHVASYQTSNDDLENYFKTASNHLNIGGLFIFDFWYGPAVYNERPKFKQKEFESEALVLKRLSKPKLIPNDNVVEVTFDIEMTDKKRRSSQNFSELHRMRYFFLPELYVYAKQTGLKLLRSYKWMTKDPLGLDSWYGVVVLSKF